MNSADILRMATEERMPVFSRQKEILAFAELVEQRAAAIEREACAKLCDEMADWPFERHASTTVDTHDYQIGIVRGLINATNAIRARSKT